MEAEAFLDAYFSIIENKTSWNTAKMVEHPLLSLQKALCVLIQAGHDKDVAAVAEPAAEYLDHFPFATQIDRSFTPNRSEWHRRDHIPEAYLPVPECTEPSCHGQHGAQQSTIR